MMRCIGLLGGMSWESSIEYERIINTEVRNRLGGTSSADLIVRSYDFHQIEKLQAEGDWAEAGRLLASGAAALEAAGAELILLCTNTMHKVAAEIEEAISVPFLHLADTTAKAIIAACSPAPSGETARSNAAAQSGAAARPIAAAPIKPASTNPAVITIALLGTRYTMEQDFYRGRLESHGLNVLVPDEPDRTMIHDIIYEELVQGQVESKSKERYVVAIERLIQQGAEGIVAGCTEIELLVCQEDMPVPFFPTAELHALAAVDWSLRE